jgi:hypothetical protein
MYNDFMLVLRLVPCALRHVCLCYNSHAPLGVTNDAVAAPIGLFFVFRDTVGLSDYIRPRSFRPALDEEKYRRDGSDSFFVMEHDPFGLVLTSGILFCREPTTNLLT